MTPEQFEIFLAENKRVTEETIDKKVNGKIDRMTVKLDDHIREHKEDSDKINAHMEDVAPIIKEYKEREVRDKLIKDAGEGIKWVAGVGIAAGAIWLYIKSIFKI